MIGASCQCGLDCSVLVLNKHYMAIRVVGAKRAFSLLCRDLAEVVSLEKDTYTNYDFRSWCEVSRFRHEFEPDAYDWARRFNEEVKKRIASRDHETLVSYETLGPDARLAIPTPEHYLPLLYALALQEPGEEIVYFNDTPVGGSLTMTSFVIAAPLS